jgi:hypothetical protein
MAVRAYSVRRRAPGMQMGLRALHPCALSMVKGEVNWNKNGRYTVTVTLISIRTAVTRSCSSERGNVNTHMVHGRTRELSPSRFHPYPKHQARGLQSTTTSSRHLHICVQPFAPQSSHRFPKDTEAEKALRRQNSR